MEKETNEPNHGNGFIKAKVKWPQINLMQVKAFSWFFFSLFRLMHCIAIQQCVSIKQMISDHEWSNHNSFHLNCLQSFTKRFLIYRINFFSFHFCNYKMGQYCGLWRTFIGIGRRTPFYCIFAVLLSGTMTILGLMKNIIRLWTKAET